MSKTIEIKRIYIRYLFLSFILGFMILFFLEHFGKYSYLLNSPTSYDNQGRIKVIDYVPLNTKASAIYYSTFFDNKITTSGNGFTANDLSFTEGDFYIYSNKIYYITEAMKLDYIYGICFSIGFFILMVFFTSFKIKLI